MVGKRAMYSYKPDWERVAARWDAFWAMEAVDRPCMTITAPRPNGKPGALPRNVSIEDRFMDPDYILAGAMKSLEETLFIGEAVPGAPYFMAGTTTGCDGHLIFHESGISIRPSMAGMDQPVNWHPGPHDPWRRKLDAILNRLLDAAPGKFIVPHPDQYPPIDLLNMLRGNEDMLLDLAMEPDLCDVRLKEIRDLFFENADHIRHLIESRQPAAGYLGWTGVWRRTYYKNAQADIAAVISPGMFERFVLPELDLYAERCGDLLFHTCGYKQHLEACLSRPYIRVIQYSPSMKEPTNGPAHIDFYHRVQQAGRGLDLHTTPDHVEFLVRHLRPEGLRLALSVESGEKAEELLHQAVKWCGTHASR